MNLHRLTFLALLHLYLLPYSMPARLAAQCIDGDCTGGRGARIDNYDNILVGDFQNGLLTGQGSCHYAWGARYSGRLHDGFPHGAGAYYQTTGLIQYAQWQHGYIAQLLQDTIVIAPPPRPLVVIYAPDYALSPFFERDLHELLHFFAPQNGVLAAQQILLLQGATATADTLRQLLNAPPLATDRIFLFVMGHLQGTTLAYQQPNAISIDTLLPLARQYSTPQRTVFAFMHLQQRVTQQRTAHASLLPQARSAQLLPLNTYFLAVEERPTIEFDGLRTSLYLHYCLLGLRGIADTNIDAAVQARELYQFVDRKIRQRIHHGLRPAQLSESTLTGHPLPQGSP